MDVDSVLQALREEEEGSDEGESGDEGDIGEEGEEEEEGMRDLMEQMAQQLKTAGFRTSLGQEEEEEEEDIGMMTNLLSSLATQPEAAGPASNILHSLGIPVPDPD